MNYSSLNLDEKLNTFTEHWSPKVIVNRTGIFGDWIH